MNKNAFTSVLSASPAFSDAVELVKKNRRPFGVVGLPNTPKAHFVSSILCELGDTKKALVLTPDEATATKLANDLVGFGTLAEVYPARTFDYRTEDAKSMQYEHRRIGVLGKIVSGKCSVVCCSIEAAMQYTIPRDVLLDRTLLLMVDEEVELERLKLSLISAGYTRSDMVEGKGQFSIRGSIVDFFPPDEENPIRVELWGDVIDSISRFDIVSQRRTDSVDEVKLTVSTEIVSDSSDLLAEKIEKLQESIKGKNIDKIRETLYSDAERIRTGTAGSLDKFYSLVYDKSATIFDYFDDCLLFACESSAVSKRSKDFVGSQNEEMKELFLDGVLCKGLDTFCVSFESIVEQYKRLGVICLDNFARGSYELPLRDIINLNGVQLPPWKGSMNTLLDDIRPDLSRGYTVVILAGNERSAENLYKELDEQGISACLVKSVSAPFIKGKVNVLCDLPSRGITNLGCKSGCEEAGESAKRPACGGISAGIRYSDLRFELITTSGATVRDLGETKSRTKRVRRNKDAFHSIDELHKGDYVVHKIHGIGVFDCITTEKVDSAAGSAHQVLKDFIKIRYAEGDVLYVPVTQLDMISKYIGASEEGQNKRIKVNKLGSPEWKKTKNKVRAAVRDMADDLVKLYAKRRAMSGFAFSPDIDMQSDFESRFEFEETDDQLQAIQEIKHDMEQQYPMDRLLCGDVGFGKTEVALRASFKCIADGKQVAMLVPTTILAMQHYRTISARFEGFPISVDMMCRFRDSREQTKIKKKLESGELDMIVGTHGILAKSVKFKDLGLLIIDEEQRFGVAQKEKLRQMFPCVDTLTLSATPIPRTLNMAMSGIRDMSVLEQPPIDRSPVQTFVLEYNVGIIREAIEKEMRRGGQVYYLYNNVDSIYKKAAEIQALFPDKAVGVGHGQMGEEELSEVWRKLVDGEIDILVCTTIIETGVDVPNVNTLIIENADRFGLAQLHQLRGRVGRSARRAYAYLTVRENKVMSTEAMSRLNAIREYTEFGSGFKIAARDLEIRGAGNILGTSQHGHIASVGYNMYMQLLDEAIAELKAKETDKTQDENLENSKTDSTNEKTKMTEVLRDDDSRERPEESECLVDLKIDAHIPEGYISSIPQRLEVYRKIADIQDSDMAMDVIDELIDRYGDLPEEVNGLVTVSLIRNDAMKHGIYKIGQQGSPFSSSSSGGHSLSHQERIVLYFNRIDPETVGKLSQAIKEKIYVSTAVKQYISIGVEDGETVLDLLKRVMKALDG